MKKLTQERLKELLYYAPEMGEFTWKVSSSKRACAGSKAGYTDKDGYRHVRINGTLAVCIRLAAEQCLNWSGCNSNSPAYKYVVENIQNKINKEIQNEVF